MLLVLVTDRLHGSECSTKDEIGKLEAIFDRMDQPGRALLDRHVAATGGHLEESSLRHEFLQMVEQAVQSQQSFQSDGNNVPLVCRRCLGYPKQRGPDNVCDAIVVRTEGLVKNRCQRCDAGYRKFVLRTKPIEPGSGSKGKGRKSGKLSH
jgi:hypothetical protein